MNRKFHSGLFFGLTLLLALLVLQALAAQVMASPAIPTGGNPLYVPLVMRVSGGGVTTPPATPTATATATEPGSEPTVTPTVTATPTEEPTPEAAVADWLPLGTADAPENIKDPALAVDAEGGMHVVYEPFQSWLFEPQSIYYAYCAGECASQEDFTAIALPAANEDEFARYGNIALDPQGRPRLMWETLDGFRYAECDGGCTDPDNWTITVAPIGRVDDLTYGSNRMFAIDASGRAHLVFNDPIQDGEHHGTFYLFCDAECTDTGNWTEVRVSNDSLEFPSLSVTSDGRPRFAFQFTRETPDGWRTNFGYMACDANCQNTASWKRVLLPEIASSYGSYSLRLTANGLPRVVLYSGPTEDYESELEWEQTYYFSCNSNCASASNWDWYNLAGLSGDNFKRVALALDSQNRPRFIYPSEVGMDYAWCEANCDTASATWFSLPIDSEAELDQTDPPLPNDICETDPHWSLGDDVSLALGPDGNPHMVYDAENICITDEPAKHTNLSWSRFATLGQP
ncbi:MAG TPA: hypothetical protein VF707_06625 [Ardenticatenaceae bacterium]|jgi:hypothetical protein